MTKMPTDYYWLVLWDGAMFLVIATYIVRMKGKKRTFTWFFASDLNCC